MHRSLSDEQLIELRVLFGTELYTKKQLALRYNCSPTTIALWIPEESVYRVQKLKYSRKKLTTCLICGEVLKGHKRCDKCTVLLHTEDCTCGKTLKEIGYWWK